MSEETKKEKSQESVFEDTLELYELLEKADPDKRGMINFDIVVPYSHGYSPGPPRLGWRKARSRGRKANA